MVAVGSTNGESKLLNSIERGGLQNRCEPLGADVSTAFIKDEEPVTGAELGEHPVGLFALGCRSVSCRVRLVLEFLEGSVAIESLCVVFRR